MRSVKKSPLLPRISKIIQNAHLLKMRKFTFQITSLQKRESELKLTPPVSALKLGSVEFTMTMITRSVNSLYTKRRLALRAKCEGRGHLPDHLE